MIYGDIKLALLVNDDVVEERVPVGIRAKEFFIDLYMFFNIVHYQKTDKWKKTLKKKLDETNYSDLEKKFILLEFDFAKYIHKGEKRKDNKEYYLEHP